MCCPFLHSFHLLSLLVATFALSAPLAAVSLSKTSESLAAFKIVFGITNGNYKEPTAAEVEALICQTNKYFESRIQGSTGDFLLSAHAIYIDWAYSPDCPSTVTVTFAFVGTLSDGQPVPVHDIFQALKLGDDEMKEYLEQVVWQALPVGSNLFYNVNTLSFEDMIGDNQIPIPGKISEAACEANQPSRLGERLRLSWKTTCSLDTFVLTLSPCHFLQLLSHHKRKPLSNNTNSNN